MEPHLIPETHISAAVSCPPLSTPPRAAERKQCIVCRAPVDESRVLDASQLPPEAAGRQFVPPPSPPAAGMQAGGGDKQSSSSAPQIEMRAFAGSSAAAAAAGAAQPYAAPPTPGTEYLPDYLNPSPRAASLGQAGPAPFVGVLVEGASRPPLASQPPPPLHTITVVRARHWPRRLVLIGLFCLLAAVVIAVPIIMARHGKHPPVERCQLVGTLGSGTCAACSCVQLARHPKYSWDAERATKLHAFCTFSALLACDCINLHSFCTVQAPAPAAAAASLRNWSASPAFPASQSAQERVRSIARSGASSMALTRTTEYVLGCAAAGRQCALEAFAYLVDIHCVWFGDYCLNYSKQDVTVKLYRVKQALPRRTDQKVQVQSTAHRQQTHSAGHQRQLRQCSSNRMQAAAHQHDSALRTLRLELHARLLHSGCQGGLDELSRAHAALGSPAAQNGCRLPRSRQLAGPSAACGAAGDGHRRENGHVGVDGAQGLADLPASGSRPASGRINRKALGPASAGSQAPPHHGASVLHCSTLHQVAATRPPCR